MKGQVEVEDGGGRRRGTLSHEEGLASTTPLDLTTRKIGIRDGN